MTEESRQGTCFVCLKKTIVYPTKIRGRVILLCKEHRKELYGA